VSWTIRLADDDPDLEAIAAIVNTVTPDNPTSADDMRWIDATYPGVARYLATADGQAVGAGVVGRIFMRAADFDAYWGMIAVLDAFRRRGIGSGLYGSISRHARANGKVALHMEARADRPEALEFLAHRGFEEYKRHKLVELDLRGRSAPDIAPPDGVTITTLAARPDLLEGVHALAEHAFPDIPGGEAPIVAGPFDEFRARDVDNPSIPKDGFAVALDRATAHVVGYASLAFVTGSTTRAFHDMTAVARAWRGRGVAGALKRATIAWAIGAGLEVLETGNDETNAPMRAVNARLGYVAIPDAIEFRGPLAPDEAP